MTQKMVSHLVPLPVCRAGHTARHIHDCRRASAGGGHLVECACSATSKHVEFDDALGEWCRVQGHPEPKAQRRGQPLATVTQIKGARPWH